MHGLCSGLHTPQLPHRGFRALGGGAPVETPGRMLALTTLLFLSQVNATDWEPPPLVSIAAEPVRLRDLEPRLQPGALVGRMFTSTVGGALGLGAGIGVGVLGAALGGLAFSSLNSTLGVVMGLVLATPVSLALAVAGLAAGASFFGERFGHAFAAAAPVAGLTLIGGALATLVLAFIVGPAAAVLVAASTAFILTPVIIEGRKPEARALSSAPGLEAAGGFSVAF